MQKAGQFIGVPLLRARALCSPSRLRCQHRSSKAWLVPSADFGMSCASLKEKKLSFLGQAGRFI
jgi:hypothetical protein